MKILGQCEFELKMSEWTGTVVATILDLDADFDIVLGLSWHRQWKPLPDWDTLDMFINTPEGALRIAHKFGMHVRLPEVQALTTLQDWPEEMGSSQISLKEAEKEIKGGAKAYLYFVREFGGDSDEDLSSARGHRVDLCSMMDPLVDSIEKGGSSAGNSSSARDPRVDPSSSVGNAKLDQLLQEYEEIFREDLPEGLPPKRVVDHAIDTGDNSPANKNAYPLSVQQLQEQTRQIDELLKKGLIRLPVGSARIVCA
jgi:hypothetical protein